MIFKWCHFGAYVKPSSYIYLHFVSHVTLNVMLAHWKYYSIIKLITWHYINLWYFNEKKNTLANMEGWSAVDFDTF